MRTILIALALAMTLASSNVVEVRAQSPTIPNFWDSQERFIRPDVKAMPRLRFLTTTDFPPFSYISDDKRLSGFHVDLARAICVELELLEKCQIQALPFEDLQKELDKGEAEALIAGLAKSPQSHANHAFTRPYFKIPARFIVRSSSGAREPMVRALKGKVTGIVANTAHAAYAQVHFTGTQLQLFNTLDDALAALQEGSVDAVFSEALILAGFLQSEPGASCCRFAGGPYLSERFFGSGLSIAVAKDNDDLAQAMNYALRSINDKGIFTELYLRYFPISLY